MDGLLVVDKPAGPTSHDVVARIRRALGEPRIGHTGTLDPAATGVLCLVLGRATRLAQFLSAADKAYEAVVRFGFATDTRDAQGRPASASSAPAAGVPSREAIDAALDAFRGTFLQQPPEFSAKKIGGTRSHALARRRRCQTPSDTNAVTGVDSTRCLTPSDTGRPVLPAPVTVTAHTIAIVRIDADTVTLRVHCSAGFYVRSLAHDLGNRLGVGAHLAALRRTRSGDFTIQQAIALDVAERDPARAAGSVIPLTDMLPGLPMFQLTTDGVRRALNGCDLGQRDTPTGEAPIARPDSLIRLLDPDGELVGIARPAGRPGFLHPAVVLM